MALSDLLNVIQQYSGASASNPPANTHEDFSKVAQTAPQTHLAGGLAEVFRSDQTPPFPEMMGSRNWWPTLIPLEKEMPMTTAAELGGGEYCASALTPMPKATAVSSRQDDILADVSSIP
jgi:hypothetical protein